MSEKNEACSAKWKNLSVSGDQTELSPHNHCIRGSAENEEKHMDVIDKENLQQNYESTSLNVASPSALIQQTCWQVIWRCRSALYSAGLSELAADHQLIAFNQRRRERVHGKKLSLMCMDLPETYWWVKRGIWSVFFFFYLICSAEKLGFSFTPK